MTSHTHHEATIAIIGAGPVGLFAAFQAGMLGFKPQVIDALDSIGGQCTALYPEKPIYDIPAHPELPAMELIEQLEAQAAPFDPIYHLGQQVTRIEGEAGDFTLTTSKGVEIRAAAVIIAAGCGAFGPNRPPLEGIEAYEETGFVRYMVTRKQMYKGKRVVIAGGGDSALDWTNILAHEAEKVYLVHRRDKFRALPESEKQMRELVLDGKVELVVPYQLDSLVGSEGQLEAVRVKTLDGEARDLEADYLLPFYGLAMELGPIAEWGLNISKSLITVDAATCETSTAGIYAIGDIATYANKLKLILCGFSEAAMATHAIRAQLYPETTFHFEYSTSKGVPNAA